MTIAHSLGGSFATAEGITFTRIGYGAMQSAGDRALAELPLGIEFRFEVDGIEMDLVSYCRSQYLAERRGGTWKLVPITSVYERDTLTPVLPGQSLPGETHELARYRPSYRFLAWYFHRQGAPLADDLLGDDRPGPVARHYAANAEWLTSALATSDSTQTP